MGISAVEWDELNRKSEQGTIFSSTKWLDLFGGYELKGVYKKDNLIGGIADFGEAKPLTPFQSVLTLKNPQQVMEALDVKYVVNHYTLPDIRPFLWKGYKPLVRYTYIVRPEWGLLDKDTRNLVRKYDLPIGSDFGYLDALYSLTFERKGLQRPIDSAFLKKVCDMGTIYTCDGAAVVIIRDEKRSYYIIGASDGTGTSSYLLWNAIKDEREGDLVGCNNRDIANFKKSFGGELKVYCGAYWTG